MTDPFDFGLMRSPEVEKEVVYFGLNKMTAVYKPLLSELIDAAYRVQTRRILSDNDFEVLKKGLYASHVEVFFYYSGKFLCQLSFVDERVRELLKNVARNSSSRVRLNAVTLMLCRPCDEVLSHVVDAGLNDRSSVVSGKTADVIGRLDLKEYANVIQGCIEKEEQEKVKEEMQYCLYWLTHDFEITEKTEYGYSIWVKTETGSIGVTINEEQFKQLDKTIEKIRNGTFRYE